MVLIIWFRSYSTVHVRRCHTISVKFQRSCSSVWSFRSSTHFSVIFIRSCWFGQKIVPLYYPYIFTYFRLFNTILLMSKILRSQVKHFQVLRNFLFLILSWFYRYIHWCLFIHNYCLLNTQNSMLVELTSMCEPSKKFKGPGWNVRLLV